MMKTYHLPLLGFASAAALWLAGCADDAQDVAAGDVAASAQPLNASEPASTLYILENHLGPNHVVAMRRDRSTGTLSDIRRYETGGQPFRNIAAFQQHAIVANQHFLYAVNPGSDNISAFRVEPDGGLQLINLVPSGGIHPGSLALHAKGFLYVANQGGIPFVDDPTPGSYAVLQIRPDGGLEEVPGGVIALPASVHPADILISPDGRYVVASRLEGDGIDSFQIAQDGRLVSPTVLANQPAPFGGVFLPNALDQVVFTLSAANDAGDLGPGVATYAVQAAGTAVRVSVTNDPASVDPCWAVVSPDATRLWTSAFLARTVTEFAVDSLGGLTRLSALVPPADDGQGATDMAIDRQGNFLYVLRAFDVASDGGLPTVPRVQVFATDGGSQNAGLRLVQDLPLLHDLNTAGVIGMAMIE